MNEIAKIYLETTIPNYATHQGKPEQQTVTCLLFQEIQKGKFEAYISSTVIDEIKATPNLTRLLALEKAIKGIHYQLIETNLKMKELAQAYVNEGIIPEKVKTDALHIAAATIATVPNLITWNLKHLANLTTITRVNNYNFTHNLPQVRILTPYELVGYLLEES